MEKEALTKIIEEFKIKNQHQLPVCVHQGTINELSRETKFRYVIIDKYRTQKCIVDSFYKPISRLLNDEEH